MWIFAVQFHTGLGDNDITLSKSTPALMQPVIKAFPNTKIVLLHSSYPFTQEAGYLTAVYRNVFLDFGEIFPFLSADGQREVVKQVLELCPTNKVMWSSEYPPSYTERLLIFASSTAALQLMATSGRSLITLAPSRLGRCSTRYEWCFCICTDIIIVVCLPGARGFHAS